MTEKLYLQDLAKLAMRLRTGTADNPPQCIAYTEAGTICRRPATVLDTQRGGMVCEEHAPRRWRA
jgi:hypothetical protein